MLRGRLWKVPRGQGGTGLPLHTPLSHSPTALQAPTCGGRGHRPSGQRAPASSAGSATTCGFKAQKSWGVWPRRGLCPLPPRPSPPRGELLVPSPRATPSSTNFWQSALRSRAEAFSGAGRLTSLGPRSPARAARSSSWGGGGGGAIPARPSTARSPASQGARAAWPCPRAPTPPACPRRPRARARRPAPTPDRAPRLSRLARPPPPRLASPRPSARPQPGTVRASVLNPKPEKLLGSRSSARSAARQAGPPPSPGHSSQRVSAACREQLQLLGGSWSGEEGGNWDSTVNWVAQEGRRVRSFGKPASDLSM